MPSKIYESLKDEYPEKPQPVVESGLQFVGAAAEQQLKIESVASKIRFTAEGGHFGVTIGEKVVYVHVIGDYCGWEEFRRRISNAVDAFIAATGATSVERIGVRYINRIVLDVGTFPLSKYFTSPPSAPVGEFVGIKTFFQRLEVEFADSPSTLICTFGTAEESDPTKVAIVLDLDVVRTWTNEEPLTIAELSQAVEYLRALERDAFESLITDDLRKRFDDDD